MNLFDILSAGKRTLNEENVSSFLAWLLDPSQSHGCSSLFLSRMLEAIDKKAFKRWTEQFSFTVSYRKASDFSVNVLMEFPVSYNTEVRRDIDVLIILSDKTSTHIIAIENKIREGASDENQLIEEFKGLKSQYSDAEISFIYLTPTKSEKFVKSYNLLPPEIIKKHWTWSETSVDGKETTFIKILRQILQDDQDAKINPLSQEVSFVLRSFVVFAENNFETQRRASTYDTIVKPTKYFRAIVAGLEGVRVLTGEVKPVYIGFDGGKSALKKTPLEKLINRPYRWDDNLAGKDKNNWLLLEDFIDIVTKKGWSFDTTI